MGDVTRGLALQVSYEGEQRLIDDQDVLQRGKTKRLQKQLNGSESSVYINNLKSDTYYTFNISAYYSKQGWGPPYSIDVKTRKGNRPLRPVSLLCFCFLELTAFFSFSSATP